MQPSVRYLRRWRVARSCILGSEIHQPTCSRSDGYLLKYFQIQQEKTQLIRIELSGCNSGAVSSLGCMFDSKAASVGLQKFDDGLDVVL